MIRTSDFVLRDSVCRPGNILGAVLLILPLAFPLRGFAQHSAAPLKRHSVFFPRERMEKVRANLSRYPSVETFRKGVVESAGRWMSLSDDELWGLMFGPRITRSWMVWSNGQCPACKKDVAMYTWGIDAFAHPWKVRCPHCAEFFPKNDFAAFHRSGLDARGIYDPAKADRSLLVNAEHPDPKDPLHLFGVDDGEGYVEGGKRWRFIGAYLVYGQFKQLVLGGIRILAAAHVLTGDPAYAHKAGVLLDRVADLYPSFDYAKQGLVYEAGPYHGYVSVWHDAAVETRELVLAYDQVFEALREDQGLRDFLAAKAKAHGLENPKTAFADVQRNIEGGILRDTLGNWLKIRTNFPGGECLVALIHTVLGWPENRAEVERQIDVILKPATAVDGVTGEKGLANYSGYVIMRLAEFLEEYARMEPGFLDRLLERHPDLRKTWRFHVDTMCLDRFYPLSGDTGFLAQPTDRYAGAAFAKPEAGPPTSAHGPLLAPSMFTFFRRFAAATGDPAYVQVLYRANGDTVEGLPHDPWVDDPEAFRKEVADVIAKHGPRPRPGSVNLTQWRLAILRSGEGAPARAAWLDYDAGGAHGQADGMNLGLFARGLDLLADFGYPQVQFGGWTSPKGLWYKKTAAHNTVVVDGRDQPDGAGTSALWGEGSGIHVIRASAPGLGGGTRYERTVALVDASDADFYVVDVFRVAGGRDHAKLLHAGLGTAAAAGVKLEPAEGGFPADVFVRGFRSDPAPAPGWSVTWDVEDRHGILKPGEKVRVRWTDLTTGARAMLGETWVVPEPGWKPVEAWIPLVVTRRSASAPAGAAADKPAETAPLESTFAGVLDVYGEKSAGASVLRLPLQGPDGAPRPDGDVAIEVSLADGRKDLIVLGDSEAGAGIRVQPEWELKLDGEFGFARKAADGKVERAAIGKGRSLEVGPAKKEFDVVRDFESW